MRKRPPDLRSSRSFLSILSAFKFSLIFKILVPRSSGMGEAIVRSWSATRTSVKCPYQCSAKYHNFETIPIALHSRKYGLCQTGNNFRPILLVFPSTNHELAKGVTHEFDRDRQEWRAVGVKEDNEKPSKDLNALVQVFGGMTLASRSPRPSSQWETEPFRHSQLYSSLLKRAQMHNNYDGHDRTIGCLSTAVPHIHPSLL